MSSGNLLHGDTTGKLQNSIRYGNQDIPPSHRRAPRMALSEAPTIRDKKVSTIRPVSNEVHRQIDAQAFEDWQPEKILTWAIENFHPRLALSASFGAPEGMALLHMMHLLEPTSRVFVLDTGRMHEATYDLIDRVRDRYDKSVEVVFPNAAEVEEMVRSKGANLFYESLENRQSCCFVRKVEPMRRYVSDLDAYVSGLRRDQNANRAGTAKVSIDLAAGGVVKINPLAEWTRDQVWSYIESHDVPVNRLHKAGYPSIGCAPCTRAVPHGGDERDGRWWWENDDTKECGLHVTEEQDQGSGI